MWYFGSAARALQNVEPPLFLAVKRNNYDSAKSLLEDGSCKDVNGKFKNVAPIHVAAKKGSKLLCSLLLRFGARVQIADESGDFPLHISVRRNDYEISQLFLENGAKVCEKGRGGVTPIQIAVKNENPRTCALLLGFGSDPNSSDQNEEPILLAAVKRNQYEIVELFLEFKGDPNKKTEDGASPLCITVKHDNIRICALLLKFQADPNTVDQNGEPILLVAVKRNQYEIVELLLEYKVDINQKSKVGMTALCTAAKNGNTRMCELILKFAPDPNIPDPNGYLPLHFIVKKCCHEIADLISQNGGNVNAATSDGITPLYTACKAEDRKMCTLLLSAGANPNYVDSYGTSPLHLTVDKANTEISELLLDYGADVNWESENETTPIHIAACRRNKELCELLLKFGANLCKPDEEGNYPLYYAVRGNYYDVCLDKQSGANLLNYMMRFVYDKTSFWDGSILVELFLQWGAESNCKNDKGRTPLQIATKRNNSKLVEILLRYDANPFYGRPALLTSLEEAYKSYQTETFKTLLNGFCSTDEASAELDWHLSNFKVCRHVLLFLNCKLCWWFADALLKHIIKLDVADLFVKKRFTTLLDEYTYLLYFPRKCSLEIDRLKAEYVGQTLFSFYDILTCPTTDLVAFLRNPDLLASMKMRPWTKKFPIYEELLSWKFIKAERRRNELDELESTLCDLFPSLPDLCIYNIMSWFNDQDVRRTVSLSKISDDFVIA